MPSVQIKNVPGEVHTELRRRAAAEGRSLQEYLLALLSDSARQEPLNDVLDRAGNRAGGRVDSSLAVDALREAREGR